jgi:hypothetical protein
LEESPPEENDELNDDQSEPQTTFGVTERIALAVVALVLGLLGAWMFWITRIFLWGGGWYDLIVGLFLDELILAVELFPLLMLIRAIFNPVWVGRVIEASSHKLVWAITGVGCLFGAAIFIFVLVIPILFQMGILD